MTKTRGQMLLFISISLFFAIGFCFQTVNANSDVQNAHQLISSLSELPDVDFILHSQQVFPSEEDLEFYKFYEEEYTAGQIPGQLTGHAIGKLESYKIRYKSDEHEVVAYISAPHDYLEKDYPVLISNRGGNNSFAKVELSGIELRASYGFIVLATQYRGVDGGSGKDRFGGDDVRDVIRMVDLAERFGFTNGKIYMFGWSRGAMETYITLKTEKRIRAAVAGAGPTNLADAYFQRGWDMKGVLKEAIGGGPDEYPDEYEKRSAVFWPEMIDTPLLIAHGTADERINYTHSEELYEKMKGLGKEVELVLFENEDHSEAYWRHLDYYFEWLLRH